MQAYIMCEKVIQARGHLISSLNNIAD